MAVTREEYLGHFNRVSFFTSGSGRAVLLLTCQCLDQLSMDEAKWKASTWWLVCKSPFSL